MRDYGTYRGLTRCVNYVVDIENFPRKPDLSRALMEEIRTVEMCWVAMTQDDTTGSEPDLLRVCVNDNHKFDIVDFTTPSKNGRLLYQNVPQEDIPTWMIEAISVLRIGERNIPVQGIGFKVHDKLYYIVDKRGENDKP